MHFEPQGFRNVNVYSRKTDRLEACCAQLEFILAGRNQQEIESATPIRSGGLFFTTRLLTDLNDEAWERSSGGIQNDPRQRPSRRRLAEADAYQAECGRKGTEPTRKSAHRRQAHLGTRDYSEKEGEPVSDSGAALCYGVSFRQ